MQDTTDSKQTINEPAEEKMPFENPTGQLKHDSAEALEEHQWHDHPGGG